MPPLGYPPAARVRRGRELNKQYANREEITVHHPYCVGSVEERTKSSGEEEMGVRGAAERGGVPRIKEGSDLLTHMTSV